VEAVKPRSRSKITWKEVFDRYQMHLNKEDVVLYNLLLVGWLWVGTLDHRFIINGGY